MISCTNNIEINASGNIVRNGIVCEIDLLDGTHVRVDCTRISLEAIRKLLKMVDERSKPSIVVLQANLPQGAYLRTK